MNEPSPPAWAPAARASTPGPGVRGAEPDWRFMLSHPAHGVALGFGSGLLRPGPGTWGTLAGWMAFVALDGWLSTTGWAVAIAVTFVIGTACAHRTGLALGRPDHGAIVIDEIVAIWVVLLMVPPTLAWQALGVAAFRLFDILKPPPIRALDGRWKNGLGVMADDLLAALYALIAVAIVTRLVA